MRWLNQYLFVLMVVMCSISASAQSRHSSGYPQPPEPAEKNSTFAPADNGSLRTPQAQPVELQREARELLELTQSLQVDIASVGHGMLPKDTIEKLKHIEKLAKHLRSEIE